MWNYCTNSDCSPQQGRVWFHSLASFVERRRGKQHQSVNSRWRYIFLGSKNQYKSASNTYFKTNLRILKEILFWYCKHHIGVKIKTKYIFGLSVWLVGWGFALFNLCSMSKLDDTWYKAATWYVESYHKHPVETDWWFIYFFSCVLCGCTFYLFLDWF